ncbi:hypothetical protein ABL78_6325 [Leptomonas seymouri]|uniref:Uncharacterized protein n=1 Tax=Leptomonas seymouri TaxID=5684 RepID=A0A0N1PBW6_LEPSE|nr:hypothetical protein ABL78_6325 [Leptomonas seymouri]|eukprot:KPI84620.1 hypothetical protein ABL78_6325 [Leptomonas seymouri]
MSFMSLPAAPTPASLTVDELEAKLSALHDYLSTPYRSRAEAILQQRRRRELAAADAAASTPVGIPSTATLEGGAASVHVARAAPSMLSEEALSAAICTAVAEPPPPVVVKHTVDSPAASLFSGRGHRAEPDVQLKYTGTATSSSEGRNPTNHRHHGRETLTVSSTAAQDECSDTRSTQRCIQRLEWQVEMLAGALQCERDRFIQLHEQVVLPLQGMVEASLRRQVELEWELSQIKGVQQQQQH